MDTVYNNFNMIQKEELKNFLGKEYPMHDICVAPYAWGNKPNDLQLRIIQSSFKPKEEGKMCISFRVYGEKEEDSKGRKCEEVTIEHKYRIGTRNIYQLLNDVLSGCTFLTAYTESGSYNNDWLKSSIIAIDIDNGLTIKEALERCEYYGLIPTFVYPTYNHNEIVDESGKQIEKFRLVFITRQVITDPRIHKLLIGMLMDIFPERDKNCSNVCRLFHGTNKGWGIIWGELEQLPKRVIDIRDIVTSFWKKNGKESTYVSSFYRSFGVDVTSGKERINLLGESGGIEVQWRYQNTKKSEKKLLRGDCENVEGYEYKEDGVTISNCLANKTQIMQEIDLDEIAENCYLYNQARKGLYWLEEPEIVHLTTNLYDVEGASEDLRKIILNSPEWYNNDRYTQEAYIQKINGIPYRYKSRTSCAKNCRFWGTEFCSCKKSKVLDNLSRVIKKSVCVEGVPSYDIVKAERQLYMLKNQIMTTDTFSIDSQIQVFPIEASVGKTQTLIQAVTEMPSEISTLIVTKLKEEQKRLYEAMYNVLGDEVAMHNSDVALNDKQIRSSRILIITHEQYKKLCQDSSKADTFSYGRNLLLIDEQIELLTYFELNVNLLNDIGTILDRMGQTQILESYANLVSPIKLEIDKRFEQARETQWVTQVFDCEDATRRIEKILESVEKAYLAPSLFKGTSIEDRSILIKHIESLKYYFNTPYLLVDRNGIHSANLNIKHLDGFNRRIILDASANFTEVYKSNLFDVHSFERVINHANTVITHVKHTTTVTAKNNSAEYWEELKGYIVGNVLEGDRCIVFGSKEETLFHKIEMDKVEIEITTYSGSRGKNTWAEYNKAFIVHTQALKHPCYVLQYIYYFPEEAKEIVGDNESIKFSNGTGKFWQFVNNIRLNNLRITDIASNMYQSIKRIDRNLSKRQKKAEVHIITTNQKAVDIVVDQLNGLGELREQILVEPKKKENPKQKEMSEVLEKVFRNLQPGKYALKVVRDLCDIKTREEFNRALEVMEKQRGCTLESMGIFRKGNSYIVSN